MRLRVFFLENDVPVLSAQDVSVILRNNAGGTRLKSYAQNLEDGETIRVKRPGIGSIHECVGECAFGVMCMSSGGKRRFDLYRWVMGEVLPECKKVTGPPPPRPMTADEMLADTNMIERALELLKEERRRSFKQQVLGEMTIRVKAVGEGDGIRLEVNNQQDYVRCGD